MRRVVRLGPARALLPARTVRLRLTALYGVVFLITGAVLLTIGYVLVRNNLRGPGNVGAELRRLGYRAPRPGVRPPPGFSPFGLTRRFGAGTGAGVTRQALEAVRADLTRQALDRLVIEYVIALGAMTMISVAAGWLLAGRALRPLRQITATARRVSGENLGERIGLEGPADELKELADTFDGMLGRLDAAFASQRHFVANASHELRTPLAIMRTEIDVSLADPRASTDELRAMGEAVRETVDRCERLIEGLLILARSEAVSGREEAVDLGSVAADCLTDMRARAKGAGLHVNDDLGPAWTRGEPALTERMIANLIENAIRHNHPGGFIEVSSGQRGESAWVRVLNSGREISPSEAETLTEPFRRLERSGEGFGLGLSIVRSVAGAHAGRCRVEPRPGGGLMVIVELPAASAPSAAVTTAPRALTRT